MENNVRLIDANALFKAIKTDKIAWRFGVPNTLKLMFNYLQIIINEQPTIDAVPVVRCKDCKYWQDNNGGYPHNEFRWGKEETPDEDDFCSCGERRGQ